jgi:hypothetical protein
MVDRLPYGPASGYQPWTTPTVVTVDRSRPASGERSRPARVARRYGPGRYRTGNRLFFYIVFWSRRSSEYASSGARSAPEPAFTAHLPGRAPACCGGHAAADADPGSSGSLRSETRGVPRR